MAFINYVSEEATPRDTAEVFERYRAPWGGVDNILRIHGANPPSLHAHVRLYWALMFGDSPLSGAQREMVALVVSAANRCRY
jgi:alkylhydroperoxidase family enzyme